jgi:hypothetical protein
MAATQAIAAYGTTVKWNSYTVAEVIDISGLGVDFGQIKVSNYSSPNHRHEYIAGWGDGGELKLKCSWIAGDTNGQRAMITDADAGTTREVIITGPTAGAYTLTFNGFIKHYEFPHPSEEQAQFEITIKITGAWTLAVTASTGATVCTGIEETGTAALVITPTFDVDVFTYTTDPINTASEWVKLTVTAAGVITATALDVVYPLVTTVLSGEITIDTADTVTPVVVTVKETGKTAKVYTIYVSRPAA